MLISDYFTYNIDNLF